MFEFWNKPPADPFMNKSGLFISSPWPVHIIMGAYLLFVLKLGKKLMEHRKPYNVRNLVLVYNIIQVMYNAILFGCGIYYLFVDPLYDLRCMNPLSLDHPLKNIERWIVYFAFLNKILDLMDTVLFVLRKSYRQITFLHVYHHAMMVIGFYWIIRLNGLGGQFFIMGTLNTFVHICMYSYYFLASSKPEMKITLWLKKYITQIQLVQFIILVFQSLCMLIFNPECDFPHSLQYYQLIQSFIMLYMFGKFYIKSYMNQNKKVM